MKSIRKLDQYEKRLLSPHEKIKTPNILLVHNFYKRIQSSMLRCLESYQNKVESLEQSSNLT